MEENKHSTQIAIQYAKDIIDGKIISNRWIKSVCKEFIEIVEDKNEKYYFDKEEAQRVLDFASFLKLSEDRFMGKPLQLLSFQQWYVSQLFGVKERSNQKRRYTKSILFCGRKQGKTVLMSYIALWCLTKDEYCSQGGHQYIAATKREQSRLMFNSCVNMVRQSQALQKRLTVYRDKIVYPAKFGHIMPLSSDSRTLDGLNASCVLLDEVAEHPDSSVYDIMASSQGSRDCPLLLSITTSGIDPESFGRELIDICKGIAEGTIEDEKTFPAIYALEEDDDIFDESLWIKANPGIFGTISIEFLRDKAKDAKLRPDQLHHFQIKHLNLWVTNSKKYLNSVEWQKCEAEYDIFDPEFIKQVESVYIGMDLASVSDMASISGVCVMKDHSWKVFSKNYLPEAAVSKAFISGNTLYQTWANKNQITITPGNICDFDWILKDILAISEKLPLKEIAFDKWNSTFLVTQIMSNNIECVSVGQNAASISPSLFEFDRRYLQQKIEHNNNPVLTWALTNAIVEQDGNGNRKFNKLKSGQKIDSAVALMMAINRAAVNYPDNQQQTMVYV